MKKIFLGACLATFFLGCAAKYEIERPPRPSGQYKYLLYIEMDNGNKKYIYCDGYTIVESPIVDAETDQIRYYNYYVFPNGVQEFWLEYKRGVKIQGETRDSYYLYYKNADREKVVGTKFYVVKNPPFLGPHYSGGKKVQKQNKPKKAKIVD